VSGSYPAFLARRLALLMLTLVLVPSLSFLMFTVIQGDHTAPLDLVRQLVTYLGATFLHADLGTESFQGGTFIRTPKYRIEKDGQSWSSKRYRAGTDPTRVIEGILALYFLAVTIYAAVAGMWMSIPFLLLFVQGYGYMAVLSYLPSLRDWWERGKARQAAKAGG